MRRPNCRDHKNAVYWATLRKFQAYYLKNPCEIPTLDRILKEHFIENFFKENQICSPVFKFRSGVLSLFLYIYDIFFTYLRTCSCTHSTNITWSAYTVHQEKGMHEES